MKKRQIAEGNVTTVEFPNKGIVMTDEGERVIVKNTIPGQRVSFAVNKVRKGKAEGRLLETVKKSPRRPQIPAGISDSAEDVRIRVCLMKNS